jgi:hypothetical protein
MALNGEPGARRKEAMNLAKNLLYIRMSAGAERMGQTNTFSSVTQSLAVALKRQHFGKRRGK